VLGEVEIRSGNVEEGLELIRRAERIDESLWAWAAIYLEDEGDAPYQGPLLLMPAEDDDWLGDFKADDRGALERRLRADLYDDRPPEDEALGPGGGDGADPWDR
jgi:hypothetical protein